MEATEFRIGNYVEYAGVLCTVEGYSKGFLETNGVIAPVSAYQSIPLDEKWFLRMGFEKKADWLFVTEKLAIEHIISEKLYGVRLILKPTSVLLRKIKYVHQLQNLYFALTGEELEFKI